MALRDGFEPANRRAKNLQATIPKAVSVHYDRKRGQIVIDLSSKLTVSFSPHDAPGLADAEPSQLEAVAITPSGRRVLPTY